MNTDIQRLLDSTTLLPQHIADLARSGIDAEQALAGGLRSCDDAEMIGRILGWKKPATVLGPCMVILFRDSAGNVTDCARVKPDKPRPDKNGKPKKYESPIKASNHAYFPPQAIPAITDSSIPLALVEGEKKALKAALSGVPTIGVTGVWNWTANSKGKIDKPLIPDLAGVVWRGRAVRIEYDSDSVRKPGVAAAERSLARALLKAGALEVKIVRLPDLPNSDKCGIDDYLLSRSPAELQALIDNTAPYAGEAAVGIRIGADEYRVNSEAAAALANDFNIYQSGNQLVRILHDAEYDERGIHRPAGPRIEPLPLPALRDRLTAVTQFTRIDKEGDLKPAHPPAWCVSAVSSRGQWPGVPVLDGAIPFPAIRYDGSILSTPGYDCASRLYLDWPHNSLRLIDKPTHKDAVAAAELLFDVVADFPFQSTVYRSAWLAGLLTPLARSTFDGPAPLFLVDANVRAAGKGKLLDVQGMIVLGTRMVIATYPKEEDELRKKVTACLVRGDRLVLLDNLTGQFGNGTLDALLTSTHWRDRILGESRMYDGPALTTWYATGNNVSIGADTARRVCHIRLESGLERPEDRANFRHPDLLAYVLQNRPQLLAAALTILRAYILARKPDMKLKPWGSYEAWSQIIRNAVVWIGQPDPGETRLTMQDQADTTAASIRSLLAALEMIDPERVGLTAAEIVARATAGDAYHADDVSAASPEVRDMLRDAINELMDKPDARKLSYRLRSIKRRIFDGRYLDEAGSTRIGSIRWAVFPAEKFRQQCQVSPASPASPADNSPVVQGMQRMQRMNGTPDENVFDKKMTAESCPAYRL